jgi:hypothetical protein
MPTIPRINQVTIAFPPYNLTGVMPGGATIPGGGISSVPGASFTLAIPDNSLELYATGAALAGIASSIVSLATALQTVIEPTGGVRVKDLLDPYQYQVVSQALVANAQPVPAGTPVSVITANPLGGAMAVTGTLAGLAAGAAAVASTAGLAATSFLGGSIGTPPTVVLVGNGFPDYFAPLVVINSALGVIGTALGTMATLVNASVDVPSRSLALKSVLGIFQVALNQQAAGIAGRVAPTPTF